MGKLIPSLCTGLRPRGGNLWLKGGWRKEKKGKFVNRREASNRRDIYMVVLGCRTVRKELVIMARYKSLNGLVNQGISCSQSEALKTWLFRATLSLLERSVWLLGSGIGKSGRV